MIENSLFSGGCPKGLLLLSGKPLGILSGGAGEEGLPGTGIGLRGCY